MATELHSFSPKKFAQAPGWDNFSETSLPLEHLAANSRAISSISRMSSYVGLIDKHATAAALREIARVVVNRPGF